MERFGSYNFKQKKANKAIKHEKPAVQKSTSSSILFKVRALYDFNPSEDGELRLQKGQIVEVLDNSTFADWWKGRLNGQTGIFPSNYVAKVEEGRVIQRSIPDENAEVLQYMKEITGLKSAIMKADPLGHNQQENEKLQVFSVLFLLALADAPNNLEAISKGCGVGTFGTQACYCSA